MIKSYYIYQYYFFFSFLLYFIDFLLQSGIPFCFFFLNNIGNWKLVLWFGAFFTLYLLRTKYYFFFEKLGYKDFYCYHVQISLFFLFIFLFIPILKLESLFHIYRDFFFLFYYLFQAFSHQTFLSLTHNFSKSKKVIMIKRISNF